MRRSFEHSFKITQQGTTLNPFPVPSLQSFASDLTVIESGGNHYFKALKGENLLITGYDFPAGWVKGFPYKSAATIDIFGQTGVPVISLFHNFDYANQYFTKHVAQVVDVNGVEIKDAHVIGIVAYSEALTGDNLTSANTYFVVPTEDATAEWIDGNVTSTETGEKAQPFKTFVKAVTSGTAGKTEYAKSKVYTENSGSNWLNLSKILNLKGIGKTYLRSASADRVVNMTSGSMTIERLVIDSNDLSDTAIYIQSGAYAYQINKCKIVNFKQQSNYPVTTTHSMPMLNCLVIGKVPATYATQRMFSYAALIDTCYFANLIVRLQLIDTIIRNSIFYDNSHSDSFSLYNIGAEFYGNTINFRLCAIRALSNYTSGKTVSIHDNKFNQSSLAGAGDSAIYIGGNAVILIKNNKLRSSDLTYSNTISFITVSSTSNNIEVSDNNTKSLATTEYLIIKITSGLNSLVKNNYIQSNTLISAIIIIGSEAISDGTNSNLIYTRNRVIGFRKLLPSTASATTHAVFISNGINNKIAHNYTSHSDLGVVIKAGNSQSYTSEGYYGNLNTDSRIHLWCRGVGALNVFNNTFIQSETSYVMSFDTFIATDENSAAAGTQNSSNIIIKNNLMINASNSGLFVNFDAYSAANGNVCDYNIYFTTVAKPFKIGSTTYSFAEWQALGYDSHSVMLPSLSAAKTLFTDFDNGDYSLASSSAAIGAGATLAGYTTLLDSATTWGSDTSIPVITTKENTSLCVGAYTR